MKALKTFIKSFEAPQGSVKIKISFNFYFNTAFRNERAFRGKKACLLNWKALLDLNWQFVYAFDAQNKL